MRRLLDRAKLGPHRGALRGWRAPVRECRSWERGPSCLPAHGPLVLNLRRLHPPVVEPRPARVRHCGHPVLHSNHHHRSGGRGPPGRTPHGSGDPRDRHRHGLDDVSEPVELLRHRVQPAPRGRHAHLAPGPLRQHHGQFHNQPQDLRRGVGRRARHLPWGQRGPHPGPGRRRLPHGGGPHLLRRRMRVLWRVRRLHERAWARRLPAAVPAPQRPLAPPFAVVLLPAGGHRLLVRVPDGPVRDPLRRHRRLGGAGLRVHTHRIREHVLLIKRNHLVLDLASDVRGSCADGLRKVLHWEHILPGVHMASSLERMHRGQRPGRDGLLRRLPAAPEPSTSAVTDSAAASASSAESASPASPSKPAAPAEPLSSAPTQPKPAAPAQPRAPSPAQP